MSSLRNISISVISVGLLMLALVGLFFSRSLLSVSMILLFLLGLFCQIKNRNNVLQLLFNNRKYLFPCLLFIVVLLSWLYSENTGDLINQLRMKLPFLALPIIFVLLPRFETNELKYFFYFFISLVGGIAVFVLINYYLHFDEINETLARGNPIPVPIDHILFSIATAFACISAFYFAISSHIRINIRERNILLLIGLLLFVFLHVLSVRTGLACLYATLVCFIVYKIIETKSKLGLVFLLLVIASPFIAYLTIPSVEQKIAYMNYDLQQYRSGDIENLSDAGRISSLIAGFNMVKKNPALGVGFGDFKDLSFSEYQRLTGETERKLLPHNQYLSWTVASGIIGLLILLIALLQPLILNRNYKNILFLCFNIIVMTGMMLVNAFERANGVAFYLLFLLILMHELRPQKLMDNNPV